METLVLVLCLLLLAAAEKSSLEVETVFGKVKGQTVESINGQKVDAFLGIPYGAPTGGSDRFSPPKDPNAWEGILDATKFSSPCYQVATKEVKQKTWWVSDNEESENCLTLNIWVPKPHAKTPCAVMVWIYGGGFAMGSSDVPLYNGATLAAQEKVIVVSLNYRLSVFGFLYLAHPKAPGNVGLMDQTHGLRWVKKNIQAFGGDPNRVTIFGQSAGGASAGYHLLIPSSLELFHNAILHSGSPTCIWAFWEPGHALEKSLLLAQHAGCPVQEGGREETIECLQGLRAEELLNAALKIEDTFLKMVFRPVADGIYLPDSPYELLSGGKFCGEKNVVAGYTREDGSFVIPELLPQFMKDEKSAYSERELKQIISIETRLNDMIPDAAVEIIGHLYSELDPDSSNYSLSLDGVVQFLTDRWIGCPITTVADKLTHKGNSVHFYRFDHIPKTRHPPWIGACHDDDLPFVFGAALGSADNPEDVKLSKQMMRYWANFAKTGDPNDDYLPSWPKYTNQDKRWLRFNTSGLTVDKVGRKRECSFWEKIYPKMDESFTNEL